MQAQFHSQAVQFMISSIFAKELAGALWLSASRSSSLSFAFPAPTFFDSLLYKRSWMWDQWFSPGVSGSREFRHNANEDALGAISTTRPGTRRTETRLRNRD